MLHKLYLFKPKSKFPIQIELLILFRKHPTCQNDTVLKYKGPKKWLGLKTYCFLVNTAYNNYLI